MAQDDGFLSRWSRRKTQARLGDVPAAAPAELVRPVPTAPQGLAETERADAPPPTIQTDQPATPPPPTLDEVATLTRESDFSRFVTPQVPGEVRNAALKKLFSDPHFNVMDGLDTYIDDYNTPDPLPASMLRKMAQAAYLGLVEPEPSPTRAAGNEPAALETHDEDPDLRLQPHHDPGPPGPGPGAGGDTGRQC